MKPGVILILVTLISCGKEAPMTPPTTNQAAAAADAADPAPQFTGILRGNVLAVGAETTGWSLETDDGKRIDVDVSKAAEDAAKLDGKRVTIEGSLATVNWPERGERKLLRARRITPAAEAK